MSTKTNHRTHALAGFLALSAILLIPGSVPAAPSSSGIVGANNPHIWYDSQSYTALDAIKNSGFNTVRIVWQTSGSGSRLQEIINRCKTLGLKPIPELHDVSGGSSASDIDNMCTYWINNKAYIASNVWINIANEWGPANSTTWRDAYKSGLSRLRAAGINNVIVIDSGGWGQDDQDILNYGPSILAQDSNVIFSIHMYGSWNDNSKINTFLSNCQSSGIPIMVGEFGYNYNGGNNNLGCTVDAAYVVSTCKSKGIGYIGWSWAGNNSENAWLDMTSDWANLNAWGKTVLGSSGAVANGTYKLIARNSGKAMDAYGQGTSNGTQIQQYSYWGGSGQKWTLTDTGSGNYKIVGVQSGKSLDVGGTANGSKVQLWDYWSGSNQLFKFAATDSGYYRITPNSATGSCLDVKGKSTADRAVVQLYQWNGGNNQQWSFQSP